MSQSTPQHQPAPEARKDDEQLSDDALESVAGGNNLPPWIVPTLPEIDG